MGPADEHGKPGVTLHASRLTPERCCYITGALDVARLMQLSAVATAIMLAHLGITAEEVSHECVGGSRGK